MPFAGCEIRVRLACGCEGADWIRTASPNFPAPSALMKMKFFLLFLFALLGTALDVHAQMSWSSYNTSGTRVSASAATYDIPSSTYTFTIPANTTHTFVTTNLAPVTLAASQTKTVTFTMTANGGFGPVGTPVINQRFIAYGLFNYGATAPGASG